MAISAYQNAPAFLSEPLPYFVGVTDAIKEIIPNTKSIYELFPTQQYSNLTSKKVLTYRGTISNTYLDTRNNISPDLREFNESHMISAESMHDKLFQNSSHINTLVNSYYIAGVGLCLAGGFFPSAKNEYRILLYKYILYNIQQ